MTKRKPTADLASDAGSASSAIEQESGRPWTGEEMAKAIPMPLPEPASDPTRVEKPSQADGSNPAVGLAGTPHAGKGQTHAAGRPEKNDLQR